MALPLAFLNETSMALSCALTELTNHTTKVSLLPSQLPLKNTPLFPLSELLNPTTFSAIRPHHVLNTILFFVVVGFLSWSLDSQHGETFKPITVVPTRHVIPLVETLPSTPDIDRRKTILRSTRARRRTIENIAQMIAIEDEKRHQLFGECSDPLDTSDAAAAVGIGGVDVGQRIWSLDQEIHLLREIDMQLQRDGLGIYANPSKPRGGVDLVVNVAAPQGIEQGVLSDLDSMQMKKKPYELSLEKSGWKTHVLLRLRVPLQWVM